MKKLNKKINGRSRLSRLSLCAMLLLLFFVYSITSCKKFVDIPPPITKLVTPSVFNNNAAATSAVTNIYTQMYANSESPSMASYNGLLADELTFYGTGNVAFFSYINAMNSSSYYGPWQTAYKYIYQANAVIAGLQQYSGASPAVKQQLTGEAYFIRAFWHFYLTDCYGAVPLVLTTDYTVNSTLQRSPRLQVLTQVITDLQTAQGLLSNNYVDASDTITTTDRVRPNKYVASALLARAYLYRGDYSNNNSTDYASAAAAASFVINNSAEYSLCTNLSGTNSVFLENSNEAIWQLYTPLPAKINTYDGADFILLAAPVGQSAISPQLLNSFEPGDQRKVNWVGSITKGANTYYFPYKYKVQTGGTNISEYTMVLRLAEQYLIRAEAKAEQGDATAVNDLNIIRNRASLPNYTGATDKASLLTTIQHERQVELFTEWGHRWFDLNRAANTASTVNVNTVMGSPGNVCQFKGGTWAAYKALYPIPQAEITLDNKLTQNPGY